MGASILPAAKSSSRPPRVRPGARGRGGRLGHGARRAPVRRERGDDRRRLEVLLDALGRPRDEALEPRHVEAAGTEVRVARERRHERERRPHAAHAELGRGAGEPGDRLGAVLGPHDELREERVVEERDLGPLLERRVDAREGAARESEPAHRPGGGREVREHVLGRHAELDRGAAVPDLLLLPRERQPRCHLELGAHEVEARHHLRDRVLDLQARVHLEEVVVELLVHEELDRPGVPVTGVLREADGVLAEARPELGRDDGRGRLLDDLLVPALERALALAEVNDVAARVGEDLDLDVARGRHVPLEEDGARAEGAPGLARRALELADELALVAHGADPLAAAARRRLEHDGEADRARRGGDALLALDRAVAPGNGRDPERLRRLPDLELVPELRDRRRWRPDPGEARVLDEAREACVLGEEAVARVDGVGAGPPGGLDELLAVEVALERLARAYVDRLVGEPDVERVAVRVREDGDRLDPHLAAGADDAHGDLGSVGDQDLLDHEGSECKPCRKLPPRGEAVPQIVAEGLRKSFHVAERRAGLMGAVAGLVSRRHREVPALDCVSFTIEPGELVGYIGPNGAGKSTTIKVLSGILVPDGGTVTVLGRVPWRERVAHVARIGVVFGQRTQLLWDLPVVESFDLLREIYRTDRDEHARARAELTELLDLGPLLDTPARQLSLGQRMRCDLAASLLHAPDILFLDEPTIGLDATSKLAVRDFVKRLNRERGTTVIL